jgi:hypothetical protein
MSDNDFGAPAPDINYETSGMVFGKAVENTRIN